MCDSDTLSGTWVEESDDEGTAPSQTPSTLQEADQLWIGNPGSLLHSGKVDMYPAAVGHLVTIIGCSER